jgi:hypothetical protein
MNPPDSKHLDTFITRFERLGKYFLMPAHAPADGAQPKLMTDLWIGKTELRVILAWKLGRNDSDAVVLKVGDRPVIPADVKDPPVLGMLEWKKMRSATRNSSVSRASTA